jgi:multiple sugar transport system ATP-binding protein
MNIVAAKLVRDDVGTAVMFAEYRLPISEEVVHARPEIEPYFGRDVILGLRPSDFEEASLVDESWARMPVTTHVTEALGGEIHVIFVVDAPPVEHKDVVDLAPEAEEGGAAVPLYEGKSVWTARVDAHSPVRAGDRIELGVDTRNLYLFDPDSGLAVGKKQAAEPRPSRRGTRIADSPGPA